MDPETDFKFDSPAGWQLCRRILKERLPFSPHDYQLEGVTAILDRRDFIGVSATGSGKSAYAYMVLHVIQSLQAQPTLCPSVKFPHDTAILMIYPTKALEEDQEKKFPKIGLTAKAINADSIDDAKRSKINLWTTVEKGISLILISPEMLSTPGFRSLIDSKVFQSRLFAIGVDEVHLLCSWGLDFRTSYQQISYVRKRFRDDVVMFGMSATLQNGKPFDTVCNFLGFRDGKFKFIRCSNARPDIHLTFRTLHTTYSSEDFPDLAWVLAMHGKTIIFCPTIHLGFRLLVYLWNLQPENPVHGPCIRMYNISPESRSRRPYGCRYQLDMTFAEYFNSGLFAKGWTAVLWLLL